MIKEAQAARVQAYIRAMLSRRLEQHRIQIKQAA